MFYCRRCDRDFPDDSPACPICGAINYKLRNKKLRPIRFLISCSDLLAILMSIVNFGILVTCSHYCKIFDYGIFAAHYFYATYYPALFPIEMAFLVSLIAAPVLSIIARRMLNQRRRSGIFMMIGVYTGLLIWSLALPLITFLATGIISPIIPIWIVYNVVFAALAVTVVILLLKNKRIKY